MKREGRQHGMVRTYIILPSPLNPRPKTRPVTQLDSPPTAGLFTKVSSKPTNHSKFTGKCGTPRCTGCHLHPACKSKDKTKGTQKDKNWRVTNEPDLNFRGLSATRMLDHLSSYGDDYVEDEIHYDVNDPCISEVDGDRVNKDDGICVSEIVFDFKVDHVEEKYEDWYLVESCA
ncbi:uncharacterized protein LOC107494889 [Arachis duranensis]|uniref:Uncharacterized protein LOC107494889 n=1 Tax=Arachis duranensis TaxID=130453 RepID=A0A6P4DNT3_ARADU|nr:uncharacterized protein LOC107494889 [Arachis duranensis]